MVMKKDVSCIIFAFFERLTRSCYTFFCFASTSSQMRSENVYWMKTATIISRCRFSCEAHQIENSLKLLTLTH